MELVILAIALILTWLLALINSWQYAPNGLSEFELHRLAEKGEGPAAYELYRRPLLGALMGFRAIKSGFFGLVLATLLVATHKWWIGGLIALALILLMQLVVARDWLRGMAEASQRFIEPRIIGAVHATARFLKLFSPQVGATTAVAVSSREELIEIINSDQKLLNADEKARIQGALNFANLKISDIMVPRDQIVTVDVKETVGPLLLDRLHKAGHNIYVVVKKDIDDIEGLLYMHDLVPLDPDLKEVKDALRPTVHYLPCDAPLEDVLAASLKTGRQLFIAIDDQGKTQGLITLADALAKLNGSPLKRDPPIKTAA